MNKNVARDLAGFVFFMLIGILAAGGCYAYADNIKEVFTPLFSVVR
jgi:hypothetical protein